MISPFTRETALNDEMDAECKDFLEDKVPWDHDEAGLQHESVEVWIGRRKITGNLSNELTEHIQSRLSKQYWKEKLHWSEETSVDWQVLKKGLGTLPRNRQHWLAKQGCDMCATGKMMKRMGPWEKDECPRCQEPESAEHIWLCRTGETESIWGKWREEIET
jgi:hypothetical protein